MYILNQYQHLAFYTTGPIPITPSHSFTIVIEFIITVFIFFTYNF